MDVLVVACHEYGLTVLVKETKTMHFWFDPSTASNALQIEVVGQRHKQTTKFVYVGGAINESANLNIEIERCIGAA